MTSLDDTIEEMANLCRDYDLIDSPADRKISEGAGKKERITQRTPKQSVAIRTRHSMPSWRVMDVKPREDYRLFLRFADGSRRVFDASLLLQMPIFQALSDVGFFMQAHVSGDSVAWTDELDIAPEYLYEHSDCLTHG